MCGDVRRATGGADVVLAAGERSSLGDRRRGTGPEALHVVLDPRLREGVGIGQKKKTLDGSSGCRGGRRGRPQLV